MILRDLVKSDIAQIVQVGRVMHSESMFSQYPYNEDRTRLVLGAVLENEAVFAKGLFDGDLYGFLIGEIVPHYFADYKVAKDTILYVSPEKRGAFGAKTLCQAFDKWAKGRGADFSAIDVSSGINHERNVKLFNLLGYGAAGVLMMKEL